MVFRLSRRAFSSLAIGSFWGCDNAPNTSQPSVGAPIPSPVPSPSAPLVSAEKPRATRLPLLHSYPDLEARLPHLSLGQFPTPIEKAEKLGQKIGVPNLWIKRDDVSGTLYGGGKTRKLEFYLAEAKAQGAREIVTFGAYGSNQAVATALWGRANGFAVRLLLAPQMPNDYVKKNLFAMRKAGAVIEVVRDGVGAAEAKARDKIEKHKDRTTYLIPSGGSSPLGNLAFVNAAMELSDQIRAGACPIPDCIYLAMGTMGSAVGLAIGLEWAGLATEVVAVRASSAQTSNEHRFWAMVKETIAHARTLDPAFPDLVVNRRRVRFQTHQLGGGYGFPTHSGTKAMQLFEEAQGYGLEPTYTAKTFAALIADQKRLADKTVLFWNSHNTRVIEIEGVRSKDFPRELQEYLE